MTAKQKVYLLILVATIARCIVALTLNLGNDEVYYLTYAQHLQWNYFDHPPMVALLIRLTTCNLYFTNDFSVRLGPILLSAVNTYMIYNIGRKIKNENTGFIAALLFTASFFSGIIAGVFIMPDAPQLFFWIISLSLLVDIAMAEETSRKINLKLLLFGLVTGLCIMSKVHGVFLWLGFGLYILFYKRSLLLNGYLYISVLITLLAISPIILWNIENDFITYTFHSDRVTINRGVNISSFFREFFGGLFYNNPVNYVLIIITLVAVFRNRASLNISLPIKRLLLLLSLPLIVILLFVALFRDTLPHWSGPGYTALLFLASAFVDSKTGTKSALRKIPPYSGIFAGTIAFVAIILINFYPGTTGKKEPEKLGRNDVTLDMYNWGFFKDAFKKLRDKDIREGRTSTTFIINNKWFPGAHIDNYIAQPLQLDFIAVGALHDIHTYAWLNKQRKGLKTGDDAYFITFSNSFKDPEELYKDSFGKINPPVTVTQYRGGKPARNMLVYLLEDYKGVPDAL